MKSDPLHIHKDEMLSEKEIQLPKNVTGKGMVFINKHIGGKVNNDQETISVPSNVTSCFTHTANDVSEEPAVFI